MRLSHIILILFVICTQPTLAAEHEISLRGSWKFSIGDNEAWALPGFDDASWDLIVVPSRWEEQGYQGYNGFAWYRKTLIIPASFSGRELFLELGFIDDVDEVYFNGIKIGQTGAFPPQYATAYNAFRKYQIPVTLVNHGKTNVIAVRTYDAQLEGGIVSGTIRLLAGEVAVIPDIDLSGNWNFNLGREVLAKTTSIVVPGAWEDQGFYNYDGYAVYSRTVNVPAHLASQKLIFLAGRIDDDDQFFVNGKLVGQTGNFSSALNSDMHREFRNYFIPDGLIQPGKNVLVIKVHDRGHEGGILEGNIGLITQENFITYWKKRRQ